MAAEDVAGDLRVHNHPTGWRRYLYSTNHKDPAARNKTKKRCAVPLAACSAVR